jgi:hypothetical protein
MELIEQQDQQLISDQREDFSRVLLFKISNSLYFSKTIIIKMD